MNIEKQVLLEMVDSGRFLFPFKEVANVSEIPLPVKDVEVDTKIHDIAPSLRDIQWAVPFLGAEKVNAFLRSEADTEIENEHRAWHKLAELLTDEEWKAMWSVNVCRLGVADSCNKWLSENKS